MKKTSIIISLAAIITAISSISAVAEDESSLGAREDISYFSASFRGGFFMPEDDVYKRIYGKWTNDIYYLELGAYPVRNLLISGAVGGLYQRGNPIGVETGEQSGEDTTFTMIPVEVGAGWRFRFVYNQPVVPFLGGGYDWVYFNEDPDPGKSVDGWKQGPVGWVGALILLDKADKEAATYMKKDYGIEHTYLELAARYNFIGSEDGLNFRGWVYTIGLSFDF